MRQEDRRFKEVNMGQQSKGKCACPGVEGVLMCLLTELRFVFQAKISRVRLSDVLNMTGPIHLSWPTPVILTVIASHQSTSHIPRVKAPSPKCEDL